MTEKKNKIIDSAIQLFIKNGYHGTSTAKVANAAHVSEGLIFRHFVNKEGLLNAILLEGQTRIKSDISAIITESDPKKFIRKVIEIPFTFEEQNYDFWRLQIKIQWELNKFHWEILSTLLDKLAIAFEKLNYPEPNLEAQFLAFGLNSIGDAVITDRLHNPSKLKAFLIKKYSL